MTIQQAVVTSSRWCGLTQHKFCGNMLHMKIKTRSLRLVFERLMVDHNSPSKLISTQQRHIHINVPGIEACTAMTPHAHTHLIREHLNIGRRSFRHRRRHVHSRRATVRLFRWSDMSCCVWLSHMNIEVTLVLVRLEADVTTESFLLRMYLLSQIIISIFC